MRTATIQRTTAETDITLTLNLDGKGESDIQTGVGFLDHMLTLFAKHGRFDLTLTCNGDTQVDAHHTTEDIGIVLGRAFEKALGDKKGIVRYGSMILPMDEALVLCSLDLCGRPYLSYDAHFQGEKMGEMSTQMVKEFFYAVSYSAMMNLHMKVLTPGNDHHVCEAMFKAFGKALDMAVQIDPRITDVLSTKGVI